MRRIFYIILLLQMSTVSIFASSNIREKDQVKTLYPLPSAILMRAYRYVGALHQFSVDAMTTNDDYFQKKMVVTFTHKIHIDLQRPGKLHIDVEGDLKHRSFYLDHGHFTIYDEDLDYYGRLNVPQKIDTALDKLFEAYNIKTSLANILYSDLDKRISPKEKGYYFGISEVDGAKCHHIGFTNEVQELQLWIEKGVRPLIRKFIVIDKTEKHLPRSGTVLRWNLHPKLDETVFKFIPSDNTVQIDVESYAKKGK